MGGDPDEGEPAGAASAMEEGASVHITLTMLLYETMELRSMLALGLVTKIGPPHDRRRVKSFELKEGLPPLAVDAAFGEAEDRGRDDSDDE